MVVVIVSVQPVKHDGGIVTVGVTAQYGFGGGRVTVKVEVVMLGVQTVSAGQATLPEYVVAVKQLDGEVGTHFSLAVMVVVCLEHCD